MIISNLCSNINIHHVEAPVPADFAWQVESFLLEVFEYGDYSFRLALGGEFGPNLRCMFFLEILEDRIIGAVGCLYAHKERGIALLGPVAVSNTQRRKGIATRLVNKALSHLRVRGCQAVYLGVAKNNPARELYQKLGFESYCGIIMRKLFCPAAEFEKLHFAKGSPTQVRQINWEHFCDVQALLAYPATIYSFDLQRGLFSSKYAQPGRFLGVFPEMMKRQAKGEGLANVLVSGANENVVGLSHITRTPSEPQRHVATLDFFVHDNFIDDVPNLLAETIDQCRQVCVKIINCYVPEYDTLKCQAIEKAGGVIKAILPSNMFIQNKYENVLLYQLLGHL